MKLIFTCLLLSFVTIQSFSCSCLELPEIDEDQVAQYDKIFKGDVIFVSEVKDYKIEIKLVVKEAFKGVQKGDTISVFTASEGSFCGLNVQKQEEWLMYTNTHNGKNTSSLCSRSSKLEKTEALSERAKKDLEYLRDSDK